MSLKARFPAILRYSALLGIAAVLIVAGIGFYRQSVRSHFKLKGEHAQLSKEVIAEVRGYERLESIDGVAKYLIRADFARTFADQHQELQNVYLEVYAADGERSDKLTAGNVLYIPEPEQNFTAYLKDNVEITSRDDLKVKSSHFTYTRANETAESDELVTFERGTMKGSSFGAVARMGERRVELLRDVAIDAYDSPELLRSNIRSAKVTSGYALLDQTNNKITLRDNVRIETNSAAKEDRRSTVATASTASVTFKDAEINAPKFTEFELNSDVRIVSQTAAATADITSGNAKYLREFDRYELRDNAVVKMNEGEKTTVLKGQTMLYEQSAGKAEITTAAYVEQNGQSIAGDRINALMFADGGLKSAVARGNARAVRNEPERVVRIAAPELNASFGTDKQISDANGIGQTSVVLEPSDRTRASLITMSAASGVGMQFAGGNTTAARTDGRTVISMESPNSGRTAANKRLVADAVRTTFQPNGKDLKRAEAIGNAQLDVDPLNQDPANYRSVINAPRFECDFYATGNNARNCVAERKVRAVRTPTVVVAGRGVQTFVSDRMETSFDQTSNNVERMVADGNAKFSELDRNAIGERMVYTAADGSIRIRGGEPTVWDDRARGKAKEIDWDTVNGRSLLSGNAATTYYSRKQMRDASPFGASDKPVFVTADKAEFDHNAEIGVYTGNARSWQENNFVRANVIRVDQKAGAMNAVGNVQSGLFNARMRAGGKESTVPVYVTAGSMAYQRDTRVVQYRENVDIKQGSDRLTAGIVDVYLDERNELSRTVAENDVVITQPGRRATGTWAQYTTADENAVLRGSPASVVDGRNGTSQGSEISFNLRTSNVTNSGRTAANSTSTRTRTVYKVQPNQ